MTAIVESGILQLLTLTQM